MVFLPLRKQNLQIVNYEQVHQFNNSSDKLTDKWLNTVNLQFYLFKTTPCFVSCRFQPGKKQRNKKKKILLAQPPTHQTHSNHLWSLSFHQNIPTQCMWCVEVSLLLATWHTDQIYYPTCQFHHSRTPPLPLHQIRKQYLIRYPCKVGTFAFRRRPVLR